MQPVLDSIEAVSERSWVQYSAMVGLEENAATAGVDRLKPHYEQLEVCVWYSFVNIVRCED